MEAAPQVSQFINRVLNMPVVTSVLETSARAYQQSKESYPLVGKTLSVAEESVSFVYRKSQPLITKLEGTARAVGVNQVLSIADDLAVQALDEMEANFLFMTQPTDQILQVVYDYANNVKARVTIVISPITGRVGTVTVTLIDKLRAVYEFVMRPVSVTYIWTRNQLETLATKAVQLIWIRPMQSVHFYIADIQTRRQRIQDIKNYRREHADEPENDAEAPPTLESLDEGYVFGLHLIYANIANRILTLESDMTPRVLHLINVLRPGWENLPLPRLIAPEVALLAAQANPSEGHVINQ